MKKNKIAIISVGILIAISTFFFILKQSSPNAFIGHADEANLANLAQNIARGNGPKIDIAWIHTSGGIGNGSLPAAESYFGLYPGFVIAPFFKIFGETRLALILPPLILQGLIVIISSKIIYKIYKKSIKPTILIAATLLLSRQLITSINGLTDIYMASCTLASIAIFSKGILENNKKMIGAGGFISGLAIGMKVSGIFSFLSLSGLIFLYTAKYISIKKLINYTLIFTSAGLLAASPYFAYNISNFNSIIPAGYQKIREARLVRQKYACNGDLLGQKNQLPIEGTKYKTICNRYVVGDEFHNYVNYNPEAKFEGNKTKAYFQLIFSNLIEFTYEFLENKILPLFFVPFAVGGTLLAFKRIYFRTKNSNYFDYETIFVLCSSPVFIIGTAAIGLLSQSQERYYLFSYPLILITAYYWLSKYLKGNILKSFLLFLTVSTMGNFDNKYIRKVALAPHYDKSTAYEKVKEIIPENDVVLTSNPWQFAFHTDRKSVALPFTSNLEIVKNVAKKYNASYLVVVDEDIRNKQLNSIIMNNKSLIKNDLLKKHFSSDRDKLVIFSINLKD